MSLHASDLLEPTGELDAAALWPKKSPSAVSSDLEEYLQEGYTKAAAITDVGDKDEAARQWAYHKAYKNVYKRLLVRPSTVAIGDEGSASYLLTQIQEVGALAQEALNAFDALVATVTAVAVLPVRASESKSFVTVW